jgi:[ribosomal protein S18]-alanine N-acetyltransferase
MPQIIELGPENFPVYAEGIFDIEKASFPSPWSISAFKAETEKHISHLWVLISDAAVSGYICFWVLESEIQLLNLAVHPEKRRTNLGQFLLTRMVEKGISSGMKNVWLEVRQSNWGARNLYKKTGFREVGIRPNYYSETNEDAILMTLELSSS